MSWFAWVEKRLGRRKEPVYDGPRFSPRTIQVMTLARKESLRLNHKFLGTEHLLLGLLKLNEGMGIIVLTKLGIDLNRLRAELEKVIPKGPEPPAGEDIFNVPLTPRLKMVIARAQREAKSLNHAQVGTEHLLLGMLVDGNGMAAHVLQSFNVNLERARKEVLRLNNPNHLPDNDGNA